jgi:alanine racemase
MSLFIKKGRRSNTILYYKQRKSYRLKIPFQDTASIENAISCLMALLYFNYDIETIQSRMLLLFPVEMRLK